MVYWREVFTLAYSFQAAKSQPADVAAVSQQSSTRYKKDTRFMSLGMQHASVTTGATIWMLVQRALKHVVKKAAGAKILGIVGKQKKTILSLQKSVFQRRKFARLTARFDLLFYCTR